jgi:hypothetical protein
MGREGVGRKGVIKGRETMVMGKRAQRNGE